MARTIDDIRRITKIGTPNGRGGKGEKETSLPSSNGRTIDDIRNLTGLNAPASSVSSRNVYDDYAQTATQVSQTSSKPTFRYNSYADYENAINAVKPTGIDNLKYRTKGIHNRIAEIDSKLGWMPSFTPKWRENYNQYKEYTDQEKEYADLTQEFEMYKQDRGNVFREYNDKYGGNADFAEKSQTLPYAIQGFANMDRLYQDQAKMSGNADTTNRIAAYNNMSDDEKALANYLANTDLNAFWKYMSDMNAIEDREIYEQGMQKKEAVIESLDDPFSKAGMNALYTIEGSADKMSSAPAIPIEYAINKVTGARQNPYGGYSGVSNMGASEQEYVAEQIRDATGSDVLPFLYNTGVSIGESWVGANAFGKTYSVLMGTTAFNNSYKELAERGASEQEIMTGALLSGAAETLFEYVSLDKLLKAKDITSASKLIKETLKQTGIEGSEEFFTEVSNIITDELSMGANSEINRMVEEMRGNGVSEDEIKRTIADYIGKRITEATLGGMLSGGVMSGSFGGMDYGINKSIGRTTDVDQLVDVIQGFDIDSDVRQKYEGDVRRNNKAVSKEDFSNKVTEDMRNKFRNMSDAEIGQAVRDAYAEASKPNRNKYRNALINEFLQYESISPEEAEEYADAVVAEKPNAIQNMILNNPVVAEVEDKVNRGIGLQMYEETNRQLARIEELSSAKVGLKELSNEGFKVTNRTTVNDNDAIIKDVIKGDNDTIRIVTNKGESNHTQMTFTFNDAHLVKIAQGIENQFKRQSFLSNYDHRQNLDDYYDGFSIAYKYGNESRGEDALVNDVVNTGLLTLEQASNIYSQGEGEKTKASDEVREAQKNLLKGFRGVRRGHIKSKGINFKKLNATQRAVHAYAKIVSALGFNVVLFNDNSAESKNGWYANGTIYINLSARYYKSEGFDTTFSINTMAHELTHFLEDMSNENNDGTFEALKNAIFKYLGEENIEELKDKEKIRWAEDWQETYDSLKTKEDKELFAEETPKEMTDPEAESEVIARACEDMLSDASTLEQVMMGVESLKKRDLLLKRIKQFIDRLGNFLKKILDNKSPSEAAELMRKDAERFEEVRQLWIKSFTSAVNSIQKAKEEEAARIKAEKESQATEVVEPTPVEEVTEPTPVEEVVEETPEESKVAEEAESPVSVAEEELLELPKEETEEAKEETEEVKEEAPAETPKETKGQFANFKAFLASQGIDPNKTDEEFIAEVKSRKKTKKNSSKVDLKVDSDGNELSKGQIEYFKDSKALDEDGDLQKVYHGTIREFYEFDRGFANMEGDWGKGFYFTTSEEDVEENYANENGADLTTKIEAEADRLEGWDEYEDMSHDEIVEALREKYITSEPITLECYLNITNPCYPTTYLFEDLVPDISEDDYETEDEYYDAVDEAYQETVDEAIGRTMEYLEDNFGDYEVIDAFSGGIMNVLSEAISEGGVRAEDLKQRISGLYIADYEGAQAGHEIARLIIESLGYDGIIDNTVSTKFKYMTGLYPDTTHYIVFNSEQAKLTSNKNPSDSKDIRYSSKVADPVSNALGLNKQLQKQNEKLREDVKRLERKLKLQKTVTKGLVVKDSSLNAITQMVTKGSKVDKSQVKEGLRDLYESILSNQKDNIIDYDSMMSKAYDIANQITSDMRKEHGDENAIAIKKMLRATPIKFTKEQKAEIEALYGKSAEEFFKGRLTISKDGRYLKDLWKKWAKNYPELFADVPEESMITELDTIYGAVNKASKAVERFQTQNDIMLKAEEIYDAFWKTGTEETLSDKHKAEIAKLKAEHRKAMAEVKQVAMEQASYRKAIAKVRDEYKETIKKREAKAKETKSKRKLISDITELTNDISTRILKNDKSKIVPAPILKPFRELVESIDFSSKRALGLTKSQKHPELNGKPTHKDERMSELLNRLSLGINRELSDESNNEYNDPYGFARLGLPENFGLEVQEISNELAKVEKYVAKNDTFTLQMMSAEELQSLYNILVTLKTAITNINKLIRAKNGLTASGVGEQIVNYANEIGEVKLDNDISQFMGIYNKVPNLFFKQLGQGGIEMFNMLKDGWDKFTDNIEKIEEFIHGSDPNGRDALYSTDEYAKWKNTVHRFNVTDKRGVEREVVMTEAQLMSLYCLSRREQGMSHLMGNGIDIDKIQTQKLVVNGIKPSQIHKFEKVDMKMQEQLVLTGEILEQMLSVVRNDSRMQTVAEKLQEFMSTICSEWINDVTMEMYGRKMANETIYFPIHVNSDVIKAEAKDKESTIFGMLNQSWLNPLKPNSKKEIDICDIFDVFKAHVADTAKYNALAIPILNLLKIWNYQQTIDLGDGQSEVKAAKKSIRKLMGDKGNLYIATLIKQINGDGERHAADSWAMKFLRKYKSAAVAFNTLSALKQPLSYVRANYDIDRKYLYKALMLKKPKIEKCFSTIGVAKWKRMGFYDTNLSLGLDRMLSNGETLAEKTLDMSLWLTEKMDEITWGYLYRAVEYEIKDKYPSLSGDEFEEAVKTRMRDILYDTQVFDSTLTRTQLMREKTAWAQTTTAFGAEPALTINMFMDAYSKFEHEARKNGNSKEAYVKAAKKHGKLMLKATYLFTLGNVLESIVSAFFKALRDYEGGDDEFADFWQNFIDRFIEEENPLTKIPYVKDIVPFAKAVVYKILKINKKVYTDQTPMNEEVFKSISNMMGELINGEFSYKDIKEMANAASQLTGLPIANAIREVKTLWNNTMGRAGFPWK